MMLLSVCSYDLVNKESAVYLILFICLDTNNVIMPRAIYLMCCLIIKIKTVANIHNFKFKVPPKATI